MLPVLTYGAETLTLSKRTANKVRVVQRAMGRAMMSLSLRDRVPNTNIGEGNKVIDAIERITNLKTSNETGLDTPGQG